MAASNRNRNRNRNTAYLLIAAGLFIILEKQLDFFTMVGLLLIGLGVYKVRTNPDKPAFIILGIGALLLISSHFVIIFAIILISFGLFYMKSKNTQQSDQYLHKQSIIESIKWDREPWELKSSSIWFVVGEVHLDLSLAIITEKETTLLLQGIIGDIDLICSEEIGVSIQASTIFGQLNVMGEKQAGMMNKIGWQSANYSSCEQKVTIYLSYIVADIDVKVV